jgi:hypothetical protein
VSYFVENEKNLTACLRKLKIRAQNRLVWDEEANEAFQKIKERIKKYSKLAFPYTYLLSVKSYWPQTPARTL